MENERFQSGNRGLLCSFRNQYNYILSFVSKLALVLLLNTNERFQDSKRSVLCGIRNPFLCIQKKYQIIELVRRSGFRSGYGSDTSVVIESHSFGVQVTRDELS